MRTTPLIGTKAWFGPRRFGWGLSPITPEGWIVAAGLVAVGLVTRRRWPDKPLARMAPTIVLVLISVAKGTSPGGKQARSVVMAARGSDGPD